MLKEIKHGNWKFSILFNFPRKIGVEIDLKFQLILYFLYILKMRKLYYDLLNGIEYQMDWNK